MTLETADRAAKRFFKKNHYRILERCCAACRFSEPEYEGEYCCKLAQGEQEEWYMGDIEPYGICDRFAEPPAEEQPK